MKYAVFGHPIAHSLSPQIHQLFAQQEQVNISYTRELVSTTVGAFEQAIQRFFADGGQGANVTLPFKIQAYDWVNQLSERAQTAGAVNTLIPLDNGQILGDNTDGVGLVQDISQNWGVGLNNKRILIIGAGGATRGVLGAIQEHKPESITVVNRTVEKAQALAKAFQIRYEERDALHDETFDIIINATSSAMTGELPLDCPHIFQSAQLVYDMMYGNEPTAFLQYAQAHGAPKIADGLGMLVCQAAHSYQQWRNFMPDVQNALIQLKQEITL